MATQNAKAKDLVTSLKTNKNLINCLPLFWEWMSWINIKAKEINDRLVQMFKERNISFLSQAQNIDPSRHLNENKLDLNHYVIKVFAENFSRFLVKLNWRHRAYFRIQGKRLARSERASYFGKTSSFDCSTSMKIQSISDYQFKQVIQFANTLMIYCSCLQFLISSWRFLRMTVNGRNRNLEIYYSFYSQENYRYATAEL